MKTLLIGSKEQIELIGDSVWFEGEWKFDDRFRVRAFKTKKEATLWLDRANQILAKMSGERGEWIVPTFFIDPTFI